MSEFEPIGRDVWEVIQELQLELSIANDRIERQFEMIADLSELVMESIDYQQETVEHLYKLHLPMD